MNAIDLAESGWIPDSLIRVGIRRLIRQRLEQSARRPRVEIAKTNRRLRQAFGVGPIASLPELANQQHYEVAPAFFERVLGRHLKYSCGYWESGQQDLDAAETRMLELCCERAQLEDGMTLLDLGCGWGSLTLFVAERNPRTHVLAVSNSKPQREFILAQCAQRDLRNVEVVTADINHFAPGRRFDRVMSVEMFEHVRNHELLLHRIASWLEPSGVLFVHHFCHRTAAYAFEDEGEGDWMARNFFSGGMMPSHDWLTHLQRDLTLDQQWIVDGTHYQKTAEAWLANQDAQRPEILQILEQVYGKPEAALWFQRWRLFFLACSELFGFANGREWWVTHTRMARPEVQR